MQSMKETASNVAASARAGMEKTKATLGEKKEKMTSRDPVQKEMAEQKKEDRINQAELEKREARVHNASIRDAGRVGANQPSYIAKGATMNSSAYSATGQPGHGTGAHQMSALPGHGTGQPAGPVTEGTATAHPTTNWTSRTTATGDRDYKTGGGYSG